MKRNTNRRLFLEALEDRCCPSVTARVNGGGTLILQGDSANLQVTQTAAGTFDVVDAGASLGSFSGVDSLRLKLRGDNDTITLDLGGSLGALERVFIQLGKGDGRLTVQNGTVNFLKIHGGRGNDTVNLADTLQVVGRLNVNLFNGDDVLNLASHVNGRANIHLGSGDDTFTFSGQIDSDGSGGSAFLVHGGNGADTVTVAGSAVLNGTGLLHLGNRNDTFVLEARTTPLDLRIFGDGGHDVFQGDPAGLATPPVNF
jgi:hypothetical protein